MQQAQSEQGDADEQPVRGEQIKEGPGVVAVGVDGQTGEQVAQADAEQQRCESGTDGEGPAPGTAPSGSVELASELEGDPADDQRGEQQPQRQVERREPGRVPGREGREHRCPGDHQPDLVAVPHRPDGVDRHPPFECRCGRRPGAGRRRRSRIPPGRRSPSRRTRRSRTTRCSASYPGSPRCVGVSTSGTGSGGRRRRGHPTGDDRPGRPAARDGHGAPSGPRR